MEEEINGEEGATQRVLEEELSSRRILLEEVDEISLKIFNSNFTNSSAMSQGGAVFIENSRSLIWDSHFYDNYAERGGAVSVQV